jgi:hypothetical protein
MEGRVVLAVVAALGVMLPAGTAAGAPPAPTFFGVAPLDGLTARDYDRMEGVVGTVRIPVYWSNAEPRRGQLQMGDLDQAVGAAADAGIEVLPFVYGSPSWVAAEPALAPRTAVDRRAWASFLRVLVRRYGPGGEFWRNRPIRRPIRSWQLWNEPNYPLFWTPRPSPRDYARLLISGAGAIRAVDPGALIVLGGIAPLEAQPPPWEYLRQLYEFPDARRSFDVVGLHPYSPSNRSLAYQVRETRRVMEAAGDRRKPIEITEIGVASSGRIRSTMIQGVAGQARYLKRAFHLLLSNRLRWRISGVVWYTWRDWVSEDPSCVFCQHAGLFDAGDEAKPAWHAFRRIALENTR